MRKNENIGNGKEIKKVGEERKRRERRRIGYSSIC